MASRVQTLRSSTKSARPGVGSQPVGALYTNFPDKQIGVINGTQTPLDLVAVRFFSDAADYAAGDYIVHNGEVLRAIGPITASPFNRSEWAAPNGIAVVSVTEPATFETGSLWLDTATGKRYFKVYEGSEWVQFLEDGANIIDLDRLQQIASQRFLGRNSVGTGNVEEITLDQALGWVLQTTGSLLSVDGTNQMVEIPPGTAGLFLQSNGPGMLPTFEEPTVDLTDYLRRDGGNTYTGWAFVHAPSTVANPSMITRQASEALASHVRVAQDENGIDRAMLNALVDGSGSQNYGHWDFYTTPAGDDSARTELTLRLATTGNLLPGAKNGATDLGLSSNRWNRAFLSGAALSPAAAPAGTVGFTTVEAYEAGSLGVKDGTGAVVPLNAGAGGHVIQSKLITYGEVRFNSTQFMDLYATPTSSDGAFLFSGAITPKSASSKIRCTFTGTAQNDTPGFNMFSAHRTGEVTCFMGMQLGNSASNYPQVGAMQEEISLTDTSEVTINIRYGPNSGTMRVNSLVAGKIMGTSQKCTLLLEEVAA